MLKISTNESAGNLVTVQLEGQLIGTWIFELNAACDRLLSAGRKITLDPGDVSLIERHGFTLLVSLSKQEVTLNHCSPFQEEQLRIVGTSQSDSWL
jgi:hypothetical protein